jgi:hypothetical protein
LGAARYAADRRPRDDRYTLDFGASVALSADGTTALVGAPGVRSEWGAAWVFTRSAAGWTRRGIKLAPVDEAGVGDGRGARFGLRVAFSAAGDTALIGGDWDHGGRGAAWVFTRTGAAWKQMGRKLTFPPRPGEDAFGRSVALSADGTKVLVGLRSMVDFNARSARGGVVLARAGAAWKRQGAPLTAPRDRTGSSGDHGASVALSADGRTALVGAPSWGGNVGAVWAFTRTRGTWSRTARPGSHDRVGDGNFGSSVALSADGATAVVGAPSDDQNAGAAYVFTRSGTTWRQRGVKLTGRDEVVEDDGMFGARLALSSDGATALVGGTGAGLHDAPGAVWTFERAGK